MRDVDATTDEMRKKPKLQPKRPSAGSITIYCDAPSGSSSEEAPRVGGSGAACTCCCHPKPKEHVRDTESTEEEAYNLMVKGMFFNQALFIKGLFFNQALFTQARSQYYM